MRNGLRVLAHGDMKYASVLIYWHRRIMLTTWLTLCLLSVVCAALQGGNQHNPHDSTSSTFSFASSFTSSTSLYSSLKWINQTEELIKANEFLEPLPPPSSAVRQETFLQLYWVKVTLVVLYTTVFLAVFLGNLLLILALALNHQLLTVTNMFLLNLAIADLGVALFCVYQNLSLYLLPNWIFGDVLCRMYHFIHAMSYTASVCIHTVIAIERYLALVKPFWARVLLTRPRLRLVVVAVWCLSALACSPRLFIYKTIATNFADDDFDDSLLSPSASSSASASASSSGQEEILCVIAYNLYNPKLYDVCYIAVCFALPLSLIGFLYTRISYHLWRSTSAARLSASGIASNLPPNPVNGRRATSSSTTDAHSTSSLESCRSSAAAATRGQRASEPTLAQQPYRTRHVANGRSGGGCGQVHRLQQHSPQTPECNEASFCQRKKAKLRRLHELHGSSGSSGSFPPSTKAMVQVVAQTPLTTVSTKKRFCYERQGVQLERLLRKRRKVIKLMMLIVVSFALFSVPFHLRKLLQHFMRSYDVASDLATGFTLLTTLLLYANSAVNPILNVCFSAKIRQLMVAALGQLLCCVWPCRRRASPYRANSTVIGDESLPGREYFSSELYSKQFPVLNRTPSCHNNHVAANSNEEASESPHLPEMLQSPPSNRITRLACSMRRVVMASNHHHSNNNHHCNGNATNSNHNNNNNNNDNNNNDSSNNGNNNNNHNNSIIMLGQTIDASERIDL